MKFLLVILFLLGGCASSEKSQDRGMKEYVTGMNYLYGQNGVKKDPKRALDYFEKSSAKNNPLAMEIIGGFYHVGMAGKEKSCEKATEWFDKSAKLGYSMAVNNLAYVLTSCEDEDFRNPYRAKDYMSGLFKKETSVITYLDTMAAVYSELEKFEKAVLYQKTVLDLAKLMGFEESRQVEIKKALGLYKNKKKLPKGYSTGE